MLSFPTRNTNHKTAPGKLLGQKEFPPYWYSTVSLSNRHLEIPNRKALGRRQIRNESWDVMVVPCSFGRVSAKFLIFAKSCRKSTPKKSLSTLEQALVRTGNNCVVFGSAASAFLFVSHGVCLMLISFMMSAGICHWGPLLALSIIITLFLCGLYCTLLWFPPWMSIASAIHLAFFLTWMFLIMNYFLKSIYLGPGYLPLGWRAVSVNKPTWLVL